MPLNIRSAEVTRLAEELASQARVSKTEAVRLALANELARREEKAPPVKTPVVKAALEERLQPLLRRVRATPATGLAADKAFYDDLNGEP